MYLSKKIWILINIPTKKQIGLNKMIGTTCGLILQVYLWI